MVVRLLNNGAQILETELGPHDIAFWREHAPAGHHLDDVHTAIHPNASVISENSATMATHRCYALG